MERERRKQQEAADSAETERSIDRTQAATDLGEVATDSAVETYETWPMSRLMLQEKLPDGSIVYSGRGHVVTIRIGKGEARKKTLPMIAAAFVNAREIYEQSDNDNSGQSIERVANEKLPDAERVRRNVVKAAERLGADLSDDETDEATEKTMGFLGDDSLEAGVDGDQEAFTIALLAVQSVAKKK